MPWKTELTASMYRFATNIPETESRTQLESRLIDAVTSGDVAAVQRLGEELQGALVVDQSLMQDLILEAVSIASVELMVELVDLLSTKNMYCYEVSCKECRCRHLGYIILCVSKLHVNCRERVTRFTIFCDNQ